MSDIVKFNNLDIQIVAGSSSLLNYCVLPIGKGDRVPTVKERNFVTSNELEQEFVSVFGDYRVKSGVFPLQTCISRLCNLQTISAPKEPREPRSPRESTSSTPPVPVTKFEYKLDLTGCEEDIRVFGHMMKDTNCYSQQLGTSGNGKGTRMSTLMEFFKALGFEFTNVFMIDDKDYDPPRKESITQIGSYCEELEMFVLGRWVKSNKSSLISWSSIDTLTGGGGFDTAVALSKYFSKVNYFAEGYVGCFTGQWWAENMIAAGYTSIHKIGYEYESKEQMLDRIVQRSGKPAKGDSSWSQNHLARGVIEHDIEWFKDHGDINHVCFMTTFDADVSIYGETFLRMINAPATILALFEEFCTTYSTLRIHTDLPSNHEKYLYYVQKQNEDSKIVLEDTAHIIRAKSVIAEYYPPQTNSK